MISDVLAIAPQHAPEWDRIFLWIVIIGAMILGPLLGWYYKRRGKQ